MCALVARELGCRPEEVLVCSTGLIGIPLPMPVIEAGVAPLVGARSADGGADAAEAIRTTDTAARRWWCAAHGFTVGGMAKGAAMLAPNMATMLAVLTTDAASDPSTLRAGTRRRGRRLVQRVVGRRMHVDERHRHHPRRRPGRPGERRTPLRDAVRDACRDLAEQMAGDAEGATKVVRVRVKGARSVEEARRAARKVAESQLVKCSLFGADPYWGRVVSELGSAGVRLRPRPRVGRLRRRPSSRPTASRWPTTPTPCSAISPAATSRSSPDLGLGAGEATILTNDLTPAYIDENMRTS